MVEFYGVGWIEVMGWIILELKGCVGECCFCDRDMFMFVVWDVVNKFVVYVGIDGMVDIIYSYNDVVVVIGKLVVCDIGRYIVW